MFNSILPPRIHLEPVFDISAVLVSILSHSLLWGVPHSISLPEPLRPLPTDGAQRIVHAACGVVFLPKIRPAVFRASAYIIRYGMVCNEQAVGIFILLCILLSGCRLCCELVGVHRACIGKGTHNAGCCQANCCLPFREYPLPKVKIISAAGGKG